MTVKTVHTLIIGAGPAGLAAATALAQAGREVAVLERLSRVGAKPCAGGVPAAGIGAELPAALRERSFQQQRLITDRQDFTIGATSPLIHTVDREKLGAWQREQATAAGAEIITGTRALRLDRQHVQTDQDEWRFSYLLGADGSNSLVRRYLGLGLQHAGLGITYQVPGQFAQMEWHLLPSCFGNGYAWIFPHRDSASVGVYAYRGVLRSHLLHERLQQWAQKRGIDLAGLQSRAALVSFDYRGARFGNILLAGDAAGLASGLTGEGIAAAIYSGRQAAAAILAETGEPPDLGKLLRRHAIHRRLAVVSAQNQLAGRLLLETLALALRHRLLAPGSLELSKPT
ncbi:MAG: NAD(P)/FAD-dependent oxidoreductase [Desulfurivibrio sp.]|nr:NAD(P)/FAD-dependent oxidoreductase [Desulfurivibrio sp.]